MTLPDLITAYLASRSLTHGSARQYRILGSLWRSFAGTDEDIAAVFTVPRVAEFLSRYTGATRNHKRAMLLRLWKIARKRHGVTEPVPDADDLERVKVNRYEPTGIHPHEFRAILAHARAFGAAPDWDLRRVRTLFRVLLHTGFRIQQVVRLRKADINFETRLVHGRPEHNKTRREIRKKLSPKIIDDIRLLSGDELFPGLSLNSLRARYNRVRRAAGLEVSRRHSFHEFRRTHGSMVANKYGDEAGAAALQQTLAVFLRSYRVPSLISARDFSDAITET